MNPYRFNGQIGHVARMAIIDGLKIHHFEIYRKVMHIDNQGVIFADNGKSYKLTLTEIKK